MNAATTNIRDKKAATPIHCYRPRLLKLSWIIFIPCKFTQVVSTCCESMGVVVIVAHKEVAITCSTDTCHFTQFTISILITPYLALQFTITGSQYINAVVGGNKKVSIISKGHLTWRKSCGVKFILIFVIVIFWVMIKGHPV